MPKHSAARENKVFSFFIYEINLPALCAWSVGYKHWNLNQTHNRKSRKRHLDQQWLNTVSRVQWAERRTERHLTSNQHECAPCSNSRFGNLVQPLLVTSARPFDQHDYHCPQAIHIARPFGGCWTNDPESGSTPPNLKSHCLKAGCTQDEADNTAVINNVFPDGRAGPIQ